MEASKQNTCYLPLGAEKEQHKQSWSQLLNPPESDPGPAYLDLGQRLPPSHTASSWPPASPAHTGPPPGTSPLISGKIQLNFAPSVLPSCLPFGLLSTPSHPPKREVIFLLGISRNTFSILGHGTRQFLVFLRVIYLHILHHLRVGELLNDRSHTYQPLWPSCTQPGEW